VTPTSAFWKWFLIGGIAATLLVVGQANELGGYAGLLQVGEESAVRPMIEEELGQIPLAAHFGHDGQISYAIGLDLLGREVPDLLDHGAYRYRRVLYPGVASLFGLLDGDALLAGMIVVAVLSAAAAAGLLARLVTQFGRSDWLALAVILNPGLWLSVRLLTSDSMAMALMLLGLLWVVQGSLAAAVAFALSGLAKDSYLTTAGGLAVSRDRRRWLLFLIPAGALTIWSGWLTLTMGGGYSSRGNLGLPFVGIAEATSTWASFEAGELFYLAFALVSVAAGLLYSAFVRSWLRWPILAWSLLGVLSTNWVWDLGNNAARVFAPIAVLIALAEARRTGTESTASTEKVAVRESE